MTLIDNGVIYETTSVGSGSGNYDSFLRLQDNKVEEGFNTDQSGVLDNVAGSFTHSIQFGTIQTVIVDGVEYVEFRLDLNESNGGTNPNISLNDLKIYISGSPATMSDFDNTSDTFGSGFSLVYDMDSTLNLTDINSGSGTDDYRFLIPVSLFKAAGATSASYVTLYSNFGVNKTILESDGGFEEWRVRSQPTVTSNPSLIIDKQFVGVTGGNNDALANAAGDVLNYTLTVTNNGNVTLTNVVVTDPFTGFTQTIATLAAGASVVLNASYTLTQGDLDTQGGGDGDFDNTATADSNETGPVSDSAEVPLVYSPILSIDKVVIGVTGDTADKDGDVISYQLVVTNTGNVTLTNVTVKDPLTGTDLLIPSLAPGHHQTIEASYTISQLDLDGRGGGDGDVDNTATADSNETGPVSDSEVVPLVYDPKIAIDKVLLNVNGTIGEAANSAGDILNYTVTVTNTGNVTLTNVTVVDPLTGQNISGVTLAPGASQTYNTSYTLTQADLDGKGGGDGDIDNTATADSNETGPVSDSETTPLVYDPKIAIDKVFLNVNGNSGEAADSDGDVLNYTVTVTNTGNITLTNVTVVDPLTGQNISGVTLAPGESKDYSTSYTLTQLNLDGQGGGDGEINNTATADSDQTGPTSDSADVPLVYAPELGINKVVTGVFNADGSADDDGIADKAGDYITYDIIVTNNGNVTLTGVSINDPLLGGVLAAGLTIGVGKNQAANGTYVVTQDDLDDRGGGDNDIDNTATADSNETGPEDDSETVSLLYNPGMSIEKVVAGVFNGDGSPDEDGEADSAGDFIEYEIKVTNTGNITLTNVIIEDPLLDLTWIGLTIYVDTSETFDGTYTITQAGLDDEGGGDGDIDNKATADSNETDPDSAEVAVPLLYDPDLDIDKLVVGVFNSDHSTDSDGIADAAGDYIKYQIIVKNTGNITLTGVSISDPLLGGLLEDALTIQVGDDYSVDGTYAITQADLDGKGGGDGEINNTATAHSNETEPESDDADVPLLYDPKLAIDKVVTGVFNADGSVDSDGKADAAGDYITYEITISNLGNITLTGVSLHDPLIGLVLTGLTLNVDGTHVEAGEYTVTQADLDGKGGGDGDIDNTAKADSDETGPSEDSEDVDLLYNPSVDIEKYVRVNQDGVWTAWLDADSPTGPIADQNDAIEFKFVVTNTGNITLTSVTVSDSVYDLNGAAAGTAVDLGTLLVGESGEYIYTGATFQAGQHTNTGTVTTTEGATDSDDANYKGLFDGPGVRTPGFWTSLNNGAKFWDGAVGNEKTGPNFPTGELLDYDKSGTVTANEKFLILGSNGDNILDADELKISAADALKFLNASDKQQQDGRWMLARDAVATWLNALAGNPIKDTNPSTVDPEHLLDDAIAWLVKTTDGNNCLTVAELTAGSKVSTSSPTWNGTPYSDHAASLLHNELDRYNNTGFVLGVQFANDGG